MEASPAVEVGARWRAPPCPSLALTQLPRDALVEVLSRLGARSLAAAACASRHLGGLAADDRFYAALLAARLPRLVALLAAVPPPAQPEWWAGRSWRQRMRALAAGAPFQLQVYNREPENEAEDFMLSAYDATVSLSPASAAALLADAPPPSLRGGTISGGHPATPTASAGELSFTARYLPMGAMPAVEEAAVAAGRLRLPPPGSAPFAVYADSGSASAAGLCVGEEVEVQWKGRRAHPWGFWFATVQSVRGNRLALMFRQYPRSSVWHRVRAPIKPGQEAVLNGDCSFGYVGGLRRLSGSERQEWRRHGAPCPPAPAALAVLAAEDEWWSDDEELDVDLELAELEEQEADAAAAQQALAAAAAVDPAAAAVAGTGAAPVAAAAAPAAEEAMHAPAGPPGQPIALQLGPAAAAAAVAAAGLPVELAAAPEAPPAPAAAPQGDQ
ncbi:F-box protein [Micractinium conductrix]|uniref:F-box protein n=1 Tax=Micractinium conductrix TaxID=554055 RepID=A0A2P6V5H0_9CHLO|nr:F-box protein [Micractinium conductrix]|eukprot:PSC69341.1 F-box protein [Micractinium conductrix]